MAKYALLLELKAIRNGAFNRQRAVGAVNQDGWNHGMAFSMKDGSMGCMGDLCW